MKNWTLPRILCIIVITLILTSVYSVSAVFEFPEENRPDWAQTGPYNDQYGFFINLLANKLLPLIGWFNIGAGMAPKYFFAEPSVIEIDYLENVTLDIVFGTYRRNSSGYQDRVFDEVTLIYDVDFPPNIQENAWSVTFDPPVMDLRTYTQDYLDQGYKANEIPNPRAKLHLKLDIPPTTENPIQDLTLRVNVSIVRKYTNLGRSGAFGGPFFGRIAAFPFRKVFNEVSIGTKGCDVFVKVKPFRNVELFMPDPIQMNLNDIKGAQIAIRNRGSHIEQFGFRVEGSGKNLLVNPPSPITLAPGEKGYANVGLVTRPIAYDRGTLHSIEVEVYPYDNPSEVLESGILTVETKGFALQGIFSFRYSWHIFFAAIIIFFILIILGILRRIKVRKLTTKPKKPWTLPDEKKHLETLLKEDKKQQYNSEIVQLRGEYKKAIINHKKKIKFELKQQRKKSLIYRPYFKLISLIKSLKKVTEKKEKEKISIPKKIKTNAINVNKIKKKIVNNKKLTNNISKSTDLQKKQILDKIKKQQQKIS